MDDRASRLWPRFRWAMWGGAALLLLLPLAMGAPWTPSDYLNMGAMLATAGGVFELGMRGDRDGAFRLGALVAVGAGFLLLWVNLAVGFLGSADNPANLIFLGVLAVAAAGALLSRGDADALSRTMVVTAAAQALAGPVGLAAGLASPGGQGVYEVAVGTTLFTALWLASAWLFRRSAGGAGVRTA